MTSNANIRRLLQPNLSVAYRKLATDSSRAAVSGAERRPMRLSSGAAWLVWTGCLSFAFARTAAYNLGNYRPVTNDEVELMSVAYKLATRGIPGSDLFAGFSGADEHYLFTLPLQHVLLATTFRVFGAGVAEARWVSLVAGVSIVWVVGWLAWRWYGIATAVVCELLLVAWPSNLTGAANDLPLFALSRVARYDVLAVAFTWFAIALLDVALRRPRAAAAVAVGTCCGLAALTTLTGAFGLPLVVLTWLVARRRAAFADRTIYWLLAGAGCVVLAWIVYAARFRADLIGQLAVYGARWDFARPEFYLVNLASEPSRYSQLLSAAAQPESSRSLAGSWTVALGICPTLVYLVWRSLQSDAIGDRLVAGSLVGFAVLLALLDETKTALYASVLLPSMCLALAAAWTGVFDCLRKRGRHLLAVVAGLLSLALALTLGLDAARGYQVGLAQAATAGDYLGLGREIERSVGPEARLLGPERWWWALHEHSYISVRSLLFQWTAADAMGTPGLAPDFADEVARSGADTLIVNDNVRGDLRDFPSALQAQFWTFLDTCARQTVDLNDPTYLEIGVYQIVPCRAA